MGNTEAKYAFQPRSFGFAVFFLLCISCLMAQIAYIVHPIDGEAPMNENFTWATVQQAKDADALWVDARSAGEFDKGHIPGAVNLNMDDWARGFATFSGVWRPGRPVVVYCGGGGCMASVDVATRLQKALPQLEIKILKGGYPTWLQKN